MTIHAAGIPSYAVLLAIAAAMASPASLADVPLAKTANDPELKWGPCPPVFPAGCEIAVLHGDPAAPNADVFFKVPANYAIPHHWHSSAERMVLVSGEMHVTYDGHATAVLKPGMYAYGPAAAPHRADCKDAGPCVLFIAFEGPVDVKTGESKP
jgi:mannose-6-phosphate isomerase-like protein (cupin superfamily)